MKGSAITGPVGKEAAELWPVSQPIYLSVGHLLTTSSVLPAIRGWSCEDAGLVRAGQLHF